MTRPVVFSGIQPSSSLMLGNYLGALVNWVKLQETHPSVYQCIYCIVDLHAITTLQDPGVLREKTYEALAVYLASGIDPKKSLIFVQSHVAAHAELAWVLGCHTWMGELARMTQFKDKSAKKNSRTPGDSNNRVGAGLYFYPVLMASDILLYNTNLVPVGHDQKQHIELARDIAIRMNGIYSEKTAVKLFTVPEPYIPPMGARIMSLQDPTRKMSKSDENLHATIFMTDSDDVITKKIKRAVTDSGSTIEYCDEKPGLKNLIVIQSAITGIKPDEIVAHYQGKMYGQLKAETAEIVVGCLKPIREKVNHYLSDKTELDRLLKAGAQMAATTAQATLKKVFNAMGFIL